MSEDYIMRNLAEIRRSLGYSLMDAARAMHASKSGVRNWEDTWHGHREGGARESYRDWLEARMDERMKYYFAIINGDYEE